MKKIILFSIISLSLSCSNSFQQLQKDLQYDWQLVDQKIILDPSFLENHTECLKTNGLGNQDYQCDSTDYIGQLCKDSKFVELSFQKTGKLKIESIKEVMKEKMKLGARRRIYRELTQSNETEQELFLYGANRDTLTITSTSDYLLAMERRPKYTINFNDDTLTLKFIFNEKYLSKCSSVDDFYEYKFIRSTKSK